MARTRVTTTKYEIMQVAAECFFSVGFTATSPRMIADELGLSTGNITYYFPSKEHLLLAIVERLCDFQLKMLEAQDNIGTDSVAAVCLETMTVAVACEESQIAREFFTAAFQSELCRNYLRENHVERAKKVFKSWCPDWTNEKYQEAELLVMGLQYAAIAPTDANVQTKTRVSGALNQILSIYHMDEEARQKEIQKVLDVDCRGISKRVLQEFVIYMKKTNEETLLQMLNGNWKSNAKKTSEVKEVG